LKTAWPRTLNKLGVPTSHDIDALIARIDELNRNVQKLQPKAAAKADVVKAVAKVPATKVEAPKAAAPAKKAVKAPIKAVKAVVPVAETAEA
jgi:hypothetical protein